MKLAKLSIFLVISVFSQFVFSAPVHMHCDIKTWGPISSSATNPTVPADYRKGGNSDLLNTFQFLPILNSVPSPSGISNCIYELSDITQIDISFTFIGTMTWDRIVFGAAGGGGPVTIDPVDPISFLSNTIVSYQFEPHLGDALNIPGPIERKMPGGLFPVTFFGDNNGFSVTAASIRLSGHHYYVPEPSTLPLFLIAIVVIVYQRKLTANRFRVLSKVAIS